MNLRQIRYFIAAAETESVSRAAQELSISQSAITSAIQALEYEMGAELFVRHAKGVRLTHEGHQLLLHARRITAAVADARRAVSARPEAMSGDLNVGVTPMVSGYYLADLLARFRRVFPQVDVRVVEDERTYLEHLLVNGELDVGLLLVSNLQDRQALESEILIRSPWRIWLPAGHGLLSHNVLTLSDLAAEPLIMLAVDELIETTTSYWQEEGLTPNIVLRTSSVEAVRSLVGMGVGLATLPDMAYRPWSLEGDRLEARELANPIPTVDVGLVWRRGAPLRPTASQFLDMCREYTPPAARRRSPGI
ncbi:MAG TPA: LysR family transcriptional regulator [Parvibaculum sp.]|uniref:LysR family transcriptional regulator n=1 Tax=Parvibaculum sp. TaxID=2024848 RepID=UPI002CD8189F|nr:LysR family transcriptional regulator [Parvibaculum sp.]HMM14264.1 LysR family transcriptional regulator [Parvibaculum sp.]